MMKQVYAIQHNVTKRVYIGITNVAEFRIKQHLGELLRGKHTNKELQRDFDKYGFDFSFYLIESNIPYKDASRREHYWMNYFKSNVPATGYNLSKQETSKPIESFKKITLKCLRGKLTDFIDG